MPVDDVNVDIEVDGEGIGVEVMDDGGEGFGGNLFIPT